jgi:hypothetical protein
MKEILIDFETTMLRIAQERHRHAVIQLKWTAWECVAFGVVGLFFLLSPLVGLSAWNSLTGIIYLALVSFLLFFVRPRWLKTAWSTSRSIAQSRLNLRRLNEE